MVWGPIVVVGIPIVRNIAGWLNASLEDGKIQPYEVKQLLTTVISMSVTGGIIYLGLSKIGIDGAAIGAATAAWIVDKISN